MAMSNGADAAVSEQQKLESVANRLVATAEVNKAKEEIVRRCLSIPAAATPAAQKTLGNAIDELAYTAALIGANSDPFDPKLVWIIAPPHQWPGTGARISGSRFAFDNPDNYYRLVSVDGASRYELKVRGNLPAPKNFSFMLYESTLNHENSKKYLLDMAIGGLHQGNVKTDADGSFTVTIDSDPANGRVNHIQSNEYAHILWVRNMFDDWGSQNSLDVTIKRVGGPSPRGPRSEAEMVERTLFMLKGGANTLLNSITGKGKFAVPAEPNTVARPGTRGGGWGYYACGSFKLADDEALVLTVAAVAGDYLSVELTDPWTVSCNAVTASGSLNNVQARPNADGTYTFVIAVKDPGVYNWLDTDGLHDGALFVRWGDLPPDMADNAVRETRRVKIAELQGVLPAGTIKVTQAQRTEMNRQRAADHARRYLPR